MVLSHWKMIQSLHPVVTCFPVCCCWFLVQPAVASCKTVPPTVQSSSHIWYQRRIVNYTVVTILVLYDEKLPVINLILQQLVWLVDMIGVSPSEMSCHPNDLGNTLPHTTNEFIFSASQVQPEVTTGHQRSPHLPWQVILRQAKVDK